MRDLTMQELAAVAGGQVGNSNAFSRATNSISVRQTNVARSGDASADELRHRKRNRHERICFRGPKQLFKHHCYPDGHQHCHGRRFVSRMS